MKKHILLKNQLLPFECKVQLASASDDGEHKSLSITTKGTKTGEIYHNYTVEIKSKYTQCGATITFTTTVLDIAIAEYNKY